jgi:hypothetical protein
MQMVNGALKCCRCQWHRGPNPLDVAAFYLRMDRGRLRYQSWCRECLRVRNMQRRRRTKGQTLTFRQARAALQRSDRARRKLQSHHQNRAAPIGFRWCSFEERYRPLEFFNRKTATRLQALCRFCQAIARTQWPRSSVKEPTP